jgi:peptide/nickel transport system substrate-binding protein
MRALFVAILGFILVPAVALGGQKSGIAMHGDPALPDGFTSLPHVDPAARRGGRITLGVLGSFDSTNPFIVRGTAAEGIRDYVHLTLLARAPDEPFSLYGLLARSVDMPDDRRFVIFEIDPDARFSDGKPVTPADVLFSYNLLREKGRPNHRTYYAKVAKAQIVGTYGVRFDFADGEDREMPLIMGLMPVLPRHAIDPETFENTTLEPPVGSGPYTVSAVDPGKSVVLRRVADWWAADKPMARGRFNFEEIRIEYYRDATTMFEAFRTGAIDFRLEDDPARWAEAYVGIGSPGSGIAKREFSTGRPAGMMAFAFNTRRAVFADARVRRALIGLFDFEWINRNLYHGLYRRTQSFFDGSMLAAIGNPADQRERDALAAFPGSVPPNNLEGRSPLPVSDGTGNDRDTLKRAVDLLTQAGYELRQRNMVERATGTPLTFEMLAANKAQERLMLAFARNLRRVGIEPRIRLVDSAEYENRKKSFDFDMIQHTWNASLSPGNEQLFRWSANAADTPGSFNYPGVKSPAVDAAIAALLAATDLPIFQSSARALDRLLMAGDYVVPLFHVREQWVAYWTHLKAPARSTLYGYDLTTWWSTRERP